MPPSPYIPRRHRRPLLFPPGLLALAWLLWLGCAALPRMRGMEKPQVFMQIAALPLHTDGFWHFDPPAYASEQQLQKYRSWQTIVFTGNQWADYFSYRQVSLAAVHVKEDTTYKLGLRIEFYSGSVYKSFIFSVDIFNKEETNRWWLDTQHKPTTLHAFMREPDTTIFFTCGTDAHAIHIPEPVVPLTAASLFQPDWRNSTLLLLLLAAISAVRLYRQHRTS